MREIFVELPEKSYSIEIGTGIIENLAQFLNIKDYSKIFFLIDRKVFELHENKILNIVKNNYYLLIDSGEKNKNLNNLEFILSKMIENNLDRASVLIAIGGGVVGDIGGLAASLFMRGINLIQIPTTLLSQVDSSVGGKTAVNLNGIKNILGTFYQPDKVYIDLSFLSSLDKKEILSGLGEIAKYGFIMDESFIEYFKINFENLIELQYEHLFHVICNSIEYKVDIIQKDENEKSVRKILNFGHTIGHGIELLIDINLSHGQGVAAGMIIEGIISYNRGYITKDYLIEIIQICSKIVDIKQLSDNQINLIMKNLEHDKKNISNKINMILPISRGRVRLVEDIKEDEIIESFRSWTYDN